MKKKLNTQELTNELRAMQESINRTGIHVEQATAWHWEQVAVTLENLDRYGELIKMEITPSHMAGKKCYHVITWHTTLLNKDLRRKEVGNFYTGLENSASRYFPKKKK